MSVHEPRDVADAVELVITCMGDTDEDGDLEVQLSLGRLPQAAAAQARLAVVVLRHYADLVDAPFEDLLRSYALRAAASEGEVRAPVHRSVQEASMLMTAADDPELLGTLVGSVSPYVLPALAVVTAKMLSNIEDVDFSEPTEVLARCARLV